MNTQLADTVRAASPGRRRAATPPLPHLCRRARPVRCRPGRGCHQEAPQLCQRPPQPADGSLATTGRPGGGLPARHVEPAVDACAAGAVRPARGVDAAAGPARRLRSLGAAARSRIFSYLTCEWRSGTGRSPYSKILDTSQTQAVKGGLWWGYTGGAAAYRRPAAHCSPQDE